MLRSQSALIAGRVQAAGLEFHHLSACLHELNGVSHGEIYRYLITAERHVGDDPRRPIALRNACRVIGHVLGGYPKRCRVPLEHHSERIAHQNHINACLVEYAGQCCVIAGEHGDLLSRSVQFAKAMQRDWFSLSHVNRPDGPLLSQFFHLIA